MEFQLDEAIEILRRTPAVLNALLRDLPVGWTGNNEGPQTWSPFDVVGHLIHGEETDWIPRLKMILERGESCSFTPFDRFAQFENSKGKSLEELLETFARLRRENLETLRRANLTSPKLALRGTHPELGSVTLAQLLATWAVHDLNHLAQIARVMCRQYADAVGAWKAYMPILTR